MKLVSWFVLKVFSEVEVLCRTGHSSSSTWSWICAQGHGIGWRNRFTPLNATASKQFDTTVCFRHCGKRVWKAYMCVIVRCPQTFTLHKASR